MRKPFDGEYQITQLFGENPEIYARFGLKGHNGMDFAAPTGTVLYSPITGTVTEVREDPGGYGNYVKIENPELAVLLAHLSRFTVGETQQVTEGEQVGWSGNTGFSTGPHLHFGIFTKPRQSSNGYNGYVDPLPYLKGEIMQIDELKKELDIYKENTQKTLDELRGYIERVEKEERTKTEEIHNNLIITLKSVNETINKLSTDTTKSFEDIIVRIEELPETNIPNLSWQELLRLAVNRFFKPKKEGEIE